MSFVRDFVKTLTHDECVSINDQFTILENTGSIDDGPLREHTRIMMEKTGVYGDNITIWMNIVVYEIWRRYAIDQLTLD